MKNNAERVLSIASTTLQKEIKNLDTHLIDDLYMDSLDAINFLFEVEKEFDIQISEEDINKHNLFNLSELHNFISR